ncbi:DUF5658 family protein [Paenibacillus aestuarii]|uniref:DUF5658 family protein n=1 Tax=Paenibacillus aestuarii TaxID=516965 RepID=A0ABW0KC23_9BACL|nr:DUF5658 family protein [Paenibacillus aestuarii]
MKSSFIHIARIRSLVLLLALCFLDAMFTDMGLRLQFIEELNPVIRHIYDWNVAGFYLIKLFLPLLFMLLYPRIQARPWVSPALTITVVTYAAVNIYHLVWLAYSLKYWMNSIT